MASADYRDVLRALKAQKIPNDQLMPTYRARLAAIEDIVRKEKIVTLPERAAVIRLASEAESTAQPAPHLSPPRLIGNTGEPAEFVLPLDNPNAKPGVKMDDFTFDAITWTLTAHEARPGHELQFARMLEAGVSIPRAVFAFNSANVEGWALYAEAVMKPYLPLDGQIGSLQMRMMRAARAFLDPMVNLGQITPDAAQQFLMDEVVLSEPMAKQEVDRYSFRAPGQATSYFYGLRAAAGDSRTRGNGARRSVRRAELSRLRREPGPAAAGTARAGGARSLRRRTQRNTSVTRLAHAETCHGFAGAAVARRALSRFLPILPTASTSTSRSASTVR